MAPLMSTDNPSPPVAEAPAPVSSSVPEPVSDQQTIDPEGLQAATPEQPADCEPVVEASAEAPPDVENALLAESAEVSSDSAPERSRPQLNPTLTEAMRPIPTLESGAPSAAPELEAAAEEAVALGHGIPLPTGEPVEVPKADQLDEALEAELAAAMSGIQLPSPTAPVPEGQEAPPQPAEDSLPPGKKVKGTVLAVHGETILLDIGVRANGFLSTRSFEEGKLPEVGASLDVVVDKHDPAEGVIHVRLGKGGVSKPSGDWNAVAVDQVVDCMVTKTNKGGLEVSISNLRGFLPASQIDYGFVNNMEQYVGQKLRVKITEVNPQKRNLVVSRRAFLEIEKSARREQAWNEVLVGEIRTGTVKTLKDYGAFVDIGGVDGLLHVGEMSWTRVNHPKDLLTVGQQIQVKILGIDRDKQKISLGMKDLQNNPWANIEDRYAPKTVVHGKVTKITDFGAFVQLEPGVEGLIHISELDHKRINRVTDVLKVDQEVDAQVLSVDPSKKRIALSVKAMVAKPEREPRPKDEDMAPSGGTPYERRRRGPLKGGGTGSGGGLFG